MQTSPNRSRGRTMKAFPHIQIKHTEPPGTHKKIYHSGMDLRDYFAGLAMQGMLSDVKRCISIKEQAEYVGHSFGEEVSIQAYSHADSMMKQRLK